MKASKTTAFVRAAIVAGLAGGATAAHADGSVNIVCGVQAEWCSAAVTAFQKETGIKVNMTAKSGGEALAQFRAEAANPKVDLWFGGSQDPHLDAAALGITEPYESPSFKDLHRWAQYLSEISEKRTVGIYTGALGFSFNTELLAKKKLNAPACWADLAKPEYKGEIQMANPNSSSTSYVVLASLVQIMGEDKAFDYLKKLHTNVSTYTRSGVAPVKAAGRGESMIGISYVHDAVAEKTNGFPVGYSTPCEGTGYEVGGMSIIKGARNMENAKKFYDWALTPAAQRVGFEAAKQYQLPSNKATPVPTGGPKFSEIKFINYDMKKYGTPSERSRLLEKWEKEINSLPR